MRLCCCCCACCASCCCACCVGCGEGAPDRAGWCRGPSAGGRVLPSGRGAAREGRLPVEKACSCR